jgi:hypothetical protein
VVSKSGEVLLANAAALSSGTMIESRQRCASDNEPYGRPCNWMLIPLLQEPPDHDGSGGVADAALFLLICAATSTTLHSTHNSPACVNP